MFIHHYYPDNKSPAHSSFSGCNEYHSVHRRMCTDCLWTKQKYKCSLYCTCDNRHFHFLLIERFHLTFPFCHSIYYFFSRRVSLFIFVNTTFANSSSPGFSSFPVHQSIRKGYPDRIKGKLSFQIHTFPSGLFVSCICLLAGLSVNYGIPAPYWLLSIFIWIGILLIIQRIMPVMEVTNPVSQIGICILCILICLPTMFAPYLSGSLLLILICFHYGYKAECAAALLLFIYAVSKYYYDLNLSLLVKSITLFFTGIIFMIAWYYFTQKRRNMKKQSRILIITNLLLLLGYLNWSIYQKEQTLRDGQLVLFELAPVDPRSLMQGDYMSLRYREATSDLLGDTQVATHGYAVLNIDSNRVARIVRLKDALEPLNDNELIINYKIVNDRLFLGAESFFFEEGQDTLYQKATYGGLKVNAKGESLLVGLYDKDFLLIKPDR